MAEKQVSLLSWVKRGKQRREIIVHLAGEQTPSEVARVSGYSLNHVSRVLCDFADHGLVKLLNPSAKTGRLYTLTKRGKVVSSKISQK